jgi:hypothetical protein
MQSGPPCPLFPLIIPSDSFEPTYLPCPSIEVDADTGSGRRFRAKVLDILGVDQREIGHPGQVEVDMLDQRKVERVLPQGVCGTVNRH